MKRKLSLFVALLITVLCAASTSAFAETDPAYEETIAFTYCPQASPVDPDGTLLAMVEEKFNVDVEIISGGCDTAAQLVAAGDAPDVFALWTGSMISLARQGGLAPIEEAMLQEHAPYLYGVWNEVNENMEVWKVDGGLYCLPAIDPEVGGASHCVVYRGDWLDALGYENAPATLEEFEQFCYDVVQKDPDGNGEKDTYAFSDWTMNMIYGAYGYLPHQFCVLEDGKISYGAIQPEMKEALAKLRQWYADGIIHPEFVIGESIGVYMSGAFANSQIAVSSGDVLGFKGQTFAGARDGATYLELKKLNPEAAEKLVWAKPIKGPYGSGIMGANPVHVFQLAFGAHMVNEPEKMARILDIFEYYSSSVETWTFSRFGIEGTHFEYMEHTYSDGYTAKIPQPIGEFGNWWSIVAEGGGTVFNFFTPMTSDAVLPERLFIVHEHPELIELYNTRKCYIDEMFVKPESWDDYGSDLDSLRATTYTDIITGKLEIDAFDSFVEEWLALGGQEVLDDININGKGTRTYYK